MDTIIEQMENGRLYLPGLSDTNDSKVWNEHPSFRGVYLKHFVTGAQTEGQFSAHLVKVEPHCVLDEHIHEGKMEMHEVVSGSGKCFIGDDEVSYRPGDIAVIPNDVSHKVVAGASGLYLLAKFVPALL